jgi:hypothetical protein
MRQSRRRPAEQPFGALPLWHRTSWRGLANRIPSEAWFLLVMGKFCAASAAAAAELFFHGRHCGPPTIW